MQYEIVNPYLKNLCQHSIKLENDTYMLMDCVMGITVGMFSDENISVNETTREFVIKNDDCMIYILPDISTGKVRVAVHMAQFETTTDKIVAAIDIDKNGPANETYTKMPVATRNVIRDYFGRFYQIDVTKYD